MKNLLKVSVAATIILAGIFAYSTRPTIAKFADPSAGFAENNASPRSLYQANCSSCHGSDGRANTAKGRETDADDLTTSKVQGMAASKMARIIKAGKGDMPGFSKKLTTAQVNQIVSYVRSL
ncbi:MAG: cytochrome c [Pyrinomonadaceae bacterium]|nr:cytochrome c [Acidobacteriota bacterium]MBK7932298.1 cytochrome c [Acidobacteriota bacterium]MBP7375357.1 cytochrome c [Pyrinomonadaceae bacterium]